MERTNGSRSGLQIFFILLIALLIAAGATAGTALILERARLQSIREESGIDIRLASESARSYQEHAEGIAKAEIARIEREKEAARRRAAGKSKIICLTYDDGPNSAVTPKLLDVLKKYNAHATFFVIGRYASANPDIVRREHAEGHAVGVHTWSHDYKAIYASPAAFFADYQQTATLLESLTGEKPRYCRMPGGSNNVFVTQTNSEYIRTKLRQGGVSCFDWNCATNDAVGPKKTAKEMEDLVIGQIEKSKRPVVLIHDSKELTPEVTQAILEHFKGSDVVFESLDAWTGNPLQF